MDAPNAQQWDRDTLIGWLESNVPSELARGLLLRGVTGVFNSSPGPVSLLAALFVAESAQDLIRHFHPIGPDMRFVGGAQQIPIMLAQRLGSRVITGAYVYRIEHSTDGVTAYAPGLKGRRSVRHNYPSANPGRQDPLRPTAFRRARSPYRIEPMGWIIKVHCIYPTRFWQTEDLSGIVNSDTGAIRVVVGRRAS